MMVNPSITDLTFTDVSFNKDEINAFNEMLKSNKSLEYLTLKSENFKDENVIKQLTETLKAHPTLTKLELNNSFSIEGLKCLLELVKDNKNIRFLDFNICESTKFYETDKATYNIVIKIKEEIDSCTKNNRKLFEANKQNNNSQRNIALSNNSMELELS